MRTLADCSDRLRHRSIAVALSGGGFRAALFSLGSLLYLVDSGQNERVTQVSSVSGGSVLNGLVLQSGDFSSMTVADIDEVAVRLLRVALDRGVIWSSRLATAAIAVVGVGFAWFSLELVFGWPVGLNRWSMIGLLAVLTTAALFRGMLVTWLMNRAFFNSDRSRLPSYHSSVAHTFCAADLNSAEPVFIRAGADHDVTTGFGTGSTAQLRLVDAVRASSAFPGAFPPRRIRLDRLGLDWRGRTQRVGSHLITMADSRTDDKDRPAARWPGLPASLRNRLQNGRAVYLADGGIWNNLATDAPSRTSDDDVLLVVDASAPLTTEPLHHLRLPLVGEVGALARAMVMLYNNTVEPRITELELQSELVLRGGPGAFPVVARMTDNTSDGLKRLSRAATAAGLMPDGTRAADVFAETWNDLRRRWREAARHLDTHHRLRVMAAQSYRTPTTFSRIAPDRTLGLIVHGYLTTMLSLGFAVDAPTGRLDMKRFERIITLQPGTTPAFEHQELDYL